jgi:hypothetical protein
MTAFLHADTRRSARRKRHHGRLANEPSTATVWAGLLSIQPVELSARWALSSTTSGQDVPSQKSDDDDRRRDSDDGNGGGSHDHAAILASLSGVETGALGGRGQGG